MDLLHLIVAMVVHLELNLSLWIIAPVTVR